MRTATELAFVFFLGIGILASATSTWTPAEERPGRKVDSTTICPNGPDPTKTRRVDLGGGMLLIEEIRQSERGQVVSRLGKVTRGGEIIVDFAWYKFAGTRAQHYYHKGKPVVGEVKDGERAGELLILLDREQMPIAVFERGKEGIALPVSEERLGEIRKHTKVVRELFGPVAEGA